MGTAINIYKKLSSCLQSFNDSTNSYVEMEKYGYQLGRQCSPYISHQYVHIFPKGHGIPWAIKLQGNLDPVYLFYSRCCLEKVTSNYCDVSGEIPGQNIFMGEIPQIFSAGALRLPKWFLSAIWDDELLYFVLPNRFSGYGEDGKPLYDRPIKIFYDGKLLYSDPEPEKDFVKES